MNTAACAECAAEVPRSTLAWTNAGEVCAECERKALAAQEPPPLAPPPTPQNIFRQMPLQISGACAAVFSILGLGSAAGMLFDFQMSFKGHAIPATWESIAGFLGVGVVFGLFIPLAAKFARPKEEKTPEVA